MLTTIDKVCILCYNLNSRRTLANTVKTAEYGFSLAVIWHAFSRSLE